MTSFPSLVSAHEVQPGGLYIVPEFGPRPIKCVDVTPVRDGHLYIIWSFATNTMRGLPVHVTRRVRWDQAFDLARPLTPVA